MHVGFYIEFYNSFSKTVLVKWAFKTLLNNCDYCLHSSELSILIALEQFLDLSFTHAHAHTHSLVGSRAFQQLSEGYVENSKKLHFSSFSDCVFLAFMILTWCEYQYFSFQQSMNLDLSEYCEESRMIFFEVMSSHKKIQKQFQRYYVTYLIWWRMPSIKPQFWFSFFFFLFRDGKDITHFKAVVKK